MQNPASAKLGSAILESRLKTADANRLIVKTCCSSIDRALGGGFAHGEISSIAGEGATDKTLVGARKAPRLD